MKEFLAVVAAALAVMIAYKFHQDRLKPAKGEGLKEPPSRPLSVELDQCCKRLLSKIDGSRPEDLVPPLEIIKAEVIARQQAGDAPRAPIYDAALQATERLIPIAEQRTATLRQVLRITSRPSPLDRKESTNTASDFFAQNVVKRWESGGAQRRVAVEAAMAPVRQAEAMVRQKHGELAANIEISPRKPGGTYVDVGDTGTGNSLDRGSYDQRRGPSNREMGGGALSR